MRSTKVFWTPVPGAVSSCHADFFSGQFPVDLHASPSYLSKSKPRASRNVLKTNGQYDHIPVKDAGNVVNLVILVSLVIF